MQPAGDIAEEELDRATQATWRLRFVPPLERLFEEEAAIDRCRRLVLQNWIGLAIYLVFMLGDWILIPDVL